MDLLEAEIGPPEYPDDDDTRALFCRYKYIPDDLVSNEEIQALLFDEVKIGDLHFFWKPEYPSSVCVLLRTKNAVEEDDTSVMKKWARDILDTFLNNNEDIADMLDRREAVAATRRRA